MRYLLLVPVLLLLVLPASGPPACAGDPDLARQLRDARRREGELQHQLQVALVRADTNQKRAGYLMRFAGELLEDLAQARTANKETGAALEAQVHVLRGQMTELQAALCDEQKRHVADVELLRQELAKAHVALETGRLHQAQLQQARAAVEQQRHAEQQRHVADVEQLHKELSKANESLEAHRITATKAQEKLRFQKQEVERLRWIYANEAPTESVARVLTNIPASHWRSELRSGDETRARVALQVLGVLPDTSAGAAEAILYAAGASRALYDAATKPLVRLGEPAVQPLVEAGCGEGEAGVVLDRGWIVHVLGEMGPVAQGALPWLEEIAAGKGRKADQAKRAVEKIRVK